MKRKPAWYYKLCNVFAVYSLGIVLLGLGAWFSFKGASSDKVLGFTAVGLGLIALNLAVRVDAFMEAMSKREFREKIALMKSYMTKIKSKELKCEPLVYDGMIQELQAALELKKWARVSPLYGEFDASLSDLLKITEETGYSSLSCALKDLQKSV